MHFFYFKNKTRTLKMKFTVIPCQRAQGPDTRGQIRISTHILSFHIFICTNPSFVLIKYYWLIFIKLVILFIKTYANLIFELIIEIPWLWFIYKLDYYEFWKKLGFLMSIFDQFVENPKDILFLACLLMWAIFFRDFWSVCVRCY